MCRHGKATLRRMACVLALLAAGVGTELAQPATLRVDVEALERMQAFQIKAGFQRKSADVRSLVDLSYLPQ